MPRKAGIFDPWRQEQPPPSQTARKKTEEQNDPSQPRHCVQFGGLRAGINVWIVPPPEEEEYHEHARHQLVDAIAKLAESGGAPVFKSWVIHIGKAEVPCDNAVVVAGSTLTLTIGSPEAGERAVARAIDSLALALRELVHTSKPAADFLTGQGIKPYIK